MTLSALGKILNRKQEHSYPFPAKASALGEHKASILLHLITITVSKGPSLVACIPEAGDIHGVVKKQGCDSVTEGWGLFFVRIEDLVSTMVYSVFLHSIWQCMYVTQID